MMCMCAMYSKVNQVANAIIVSHREFTDTRSSAVEMQIKHTTLHVIFKKNVRQLSHY